MVTSSGPREVHPAPCRRSGVPGRSGSNQRPIPRRFAGESQIQIPNQDFCEEGVQWMGSRARVGLVRIPRLLPVLQQMRGGDSGAGGMSERRVGVVVVVQWLRRRRSCPHSGENVRNVHLAAWGRGGVVSGGEAARGAASLGRGPAAREGAWRAERARRPRRWAECTVCWPLERGPAARQGARRAERAGRPRRWGERASCWWCHCVSVWAPTGRPRRPRPVGDGDEPCRASVAVGECRRHACLGQWPSWVTRRLRRQW